MMTLLLPFLITLLVIVQFGSCAQVCNVDEDCIRSGRCNPTDDLYQEVLCKCYKWQSNAFCLSSVRIKSWDEIKCNESSDCLNYGRPPNPGQSPCLVFPAPVCECQSSKCVVIKKECSFNEDCKFQDKCQNIGRKKCECVSGNCEIRDECNTNMDCRRRCPADASCSCQFGKCTITGGLPLRRD